MMLVDSHCHLDFPELSQDLDAVVARAGAAGVGLILTICTRPSRLSESLAIAERFAHVYCAVGVHPHEAAAEPITLDALVALTRHPKIVGIGESGLDYHYDHAPRDVQQASFRLHAEAAQRTGLPLIVHTRNAEADTIAILREARAQEPGRGPLTGIIHCFSGTQQLADDALDLGFHISFSGILTFKTAEALRTIARSVPADRLLVETDAPYLAPVPRRGRANEPSFILHTARQLADLQGLSVEELGAVTTRNFHRLFTRIPSAAP